MQDLIAAKANHRIRRGNDMSTRGAKIQGVIADSIAAELELEPGDLLLAINGTPLLDYLDFLYLSTACELILTVQKKSGVLLEIEFEKEEDEPLGLSFETAVFDGIHLCANHCLFCFVHQFPAGQRSSLYVQDDDYRLSFLDGCYITLTNLTETEWQRIERMRLSPLYISVHATESKVRCRLLGSKAAGAIMDQLRRLKTAGITVHTQAVICPGINDGPILERTIADLAGLWPEVASLAIVPVGLTGHRERLYSLRPFTAVEAGIVLDRITACQQKYLTELGSRFVFAADEWYVLAGRAVPTDAEYEDYLQLDNGIGLIRWFCEEFQQFYRENQAALAQIKLKAVIITGKSATGMWRELLPLVADGTPDLNLRVLSVENHFLGPTVTVTGLLTGRDLAAAIQADTVTDDPLYLIPEITLKQGEALFLDGLDPAGLAEMVKPKRITIVPTRASALLEWMKERKV
jgi:putative radical SAM enzyme (TIGR03279 family)